MKHGLVGSLFPKTTSKNLADNKLNYSGQFLLQQAQSKHLVNQFELNRWQCYDTENGKFPGKMSKKSQFFWTGSNVKKAKTGKISKKTGKIFVLQIILSDRKISVKNSAVFFVITYLPVRITGHFFFQQELLRLPKTAGSPTTTTKRRRH